MLYLITQYQLLMIDQKLAIITIHDVNPSHSEKILKTSDELDKLYMSSLLLHNENWRSLVIVIYLF